MMMTILKKVGWTLGILAGFNLALTFFPKEIRETLWAIVYNPRGLFLGGNNG